MTAPNGFAVCNGQLLSVSQYPELFAVLGDSHGGDGVTTFALPNLRSAGGYQTIIRVCNAAVAVAPTAAIVPCVIHGPMPDNYRAGDVLAFTVQLLDPVTVAGGPPKLSVTINSSTYLLDPLPGATATEWPYQHTMTTDDSGALSAAIDLNGAALTTGSVPATLSVAYLSNNKNLATEFLSATMTPDAESRSVTQVHSLSGAEATMTPTADTGVIV
ncbi:MAG: phage tail protein [Methylobacter tundripaludum]|nr:phage tail protein [Methylobacter tundripaludum]